MSTASQKAANKRWLLKIREDRKRYAKYLAARRKYAKKWRNSGGLLIQRKSQNSSNARLKIRVLTHYGKNGLLMCCWKNCIVCDIDLLTLDHIENNGSKHREKGYKFGVNGFRQLEQEGLPKGFQTLCANHQLKKEILRRKKDRR